jgi:hypothetical protein
MRCQPPAEIPPDAPCPRHASPRTPPARAAGEDVIHMHNELIRGEPVEPIFLKGFLGELRSIILISPLFLGPSGPFRLAAALRLTRPSGPRRRDQCGRGLEGLRCAAGEARLAPPASAARRLARLAVGPSTAESCRRWRALTRGRGLKRPCGLGRWRWRGVLRSAVVAGGGDVKRDHAVARECASRLGLLGDDESQQRGVSAERPLKAGAQPSATHCLSGVPGPLAGVVAHDLTARRVGSTRAGRALDCCGLVTHQGY